MLLAPLALSLALAAPPAGALADDPLLAALETELGRASDALGEQQSPPYHLAASLTDLQAVELSAEDGGLLGYSPMEQRYLDVDLRLGGPELDSSHPLRSGRFGRRGRSGRAVPLGLDPALVRRATWREIEARYATARERWAQVESDRQVLVEEIPAPDLAPTEPVVDLREPAALQANLPAWEETLRQASAVLARSAVVYDGAVRFAGKAATHRFVSSEGTRLRHSTSRYMVRIQMDTVADDGTELHLGRQWSAHSAAGLPERAELVRQATELEALLAALRVAPEQEPYTGPAILGDRAAAVFFHEILGHRLEGHRLKRVEDAQTLRNQVGQPIMPAFLSLVDDPTLAHYANSDLNGHYAYDDQGVPAARVTLVQDGLLQGFLESRSPSAQGRLSNGHGRRQPGYDPVARQANLVVEASRSVSDAELRQQLRDLASAQGLEYGLFVDSIQGGYTLTGRNMPNAFSVDVLVAWRVYTDGRPDELVRGINLIGTPLVTLSRIVAAGEVHRVFNGMCGAESGQVPVAAVAPALLISQVETQRKAKGQDTPPLLPAPGSEG